MIFFLKGIVQELTPTYAVLDVNGVGYYVGISLQTSNKLNLGKETFIYTQQIIREDAHLLFGFHKKEEKEKALEANQWKMSYIDGISQQLKEILSF